MKGLCLGSEEEALIINSCQFTNKLRQFTKKKFENVNCCMLTFLHADSLCANLLYVSLISANLPCATLLYASFLYVNLLSANLLDANLLYANLLCSILKSVNLGHFN